MRAVILLLPLLAGACAVTAASQGALDTATAACSQGDRKACAQLPALNAQVRQENANNAAATGIAAAAGGAVIGGAVRLPVRLPPIRLSLPVPLRLSAVLWLLVIISPIDRHLVPNS